MNNRKTKIIRMTTVAGSLRKLLGSQLVFMKSHYNILLSANNKNEELSKLGKQLDLETRAIPLTREITPIKDLISLFITVKLFLKEKPFIVHTHTPKAGIIGMLAAKIAFVPNRLHTVAGLPLVVATGKKRKVLNFVERLTYSCATKVYPNSLGLKEIIIKEKLIKSPDKLKVLGYGSSNGIDTDYFSKNQISETVINEVKKEISFSEKDFLFIFIGRIVKDKGINELAEAFQNLQKDNKNIKLILLGRYEDQLNPISEISKKIINTNSRIIHLGFKEDVRPYLAVSHVMVFPSYREGFPNVVMQACAMEVPSIVTNINGCNELIENQESGLIIPVKDSKNLYESMKTMISNKENLNSYGIKGRNEVISKFKQEFVWEELLKEYKACENV
ncbi:glycosyltransferase family 4 protein [Olleya namhaensis]|uniref:glycosyltransferase family 4 protein n=1 Tax=Olleya namhaensis TaxID=1144750 RepID=UPI002492CED3|nr:glycosyltransferase family 4 protein [Olleya namhaensis]